MELLSFKQARAYWNKSNIALDSLKILITTSRLKIFRKSKSSNAKEFWRYDVKKFIIRMIIVIPILLFITVFCFDNIKRNSVYYAKHTPHKEGTEPVLMMVVDNLEWIYNPKVKTLKYDFDGKPCVQFFTSNGKQTGFISPFCGDDKNKKNYIYADNESEITLILDCNFNPEIAYDYGHKKIPLN